MSKDNIKTVKRQISNAVLLPEIVKMLGKGHTVTLPLRGYSMRPFLEDGRDKAVLKATKAPRKGDVVLAETFPGRYVLHRIITIESDIITLRGDGNIATEQCRKADVKAVAIAFYRKSRNVADRTDGLKWRIYSWLWLRLYPVRRYLLFIYRKVYNA